MLMNNQNINKTDNCQNFPSDDSCTNYSLVGNKLAFLNLPILGK